MKLLTLLILCIGFLLINFLLRRLLSYVKNKTKIMGIVNRYFSLVELLFWALFVFWSSTILFSGSPYLPYLIYLLITLVVVLFFWYFLRDYIAGIQLKSRYNFSKGQSFKSAQVTGVVKKIRLLFFEVKADNGSDFRIPYSQIDQKSIEFNIQEKSGGESIIKVDLDEKLDEDKTIKRITELVINSPWSSHKSNLNIEVSDNVNGQKTYEISCVTNGENAGRKLKELIERGISGKKIISKP